MNPAGVPGGVEVYLGPGDFHFGQGRTRIRTLLGSCVAITLWHPQRLLGGMCHYLLPRRGISQRLSGGHYAEEALQMFLAAMQRAGTRPEEYEVKMFGGGNMFGTLGDAESRLNVSRDNVIAGERLLQQHGFEVKARDVGGSQYRKLCFELWNGSVWVQRCNVATSGRS